jgi:GntR family transcriptional regulator
MTSGSIAAVVAEGHPASAGDLGSFDGLVIERRPGVPLYLQLKQAIADAISTGVLAPGVRLPSEAHLCDRFGLSRTTVRQALSELESEGSLRREQGRGTFVSDTAPRSGFLQSSAGFFEEAVAAGMRVDTEVLSRTVEPMPAWAAGALGLEAGTHGVRLERIRSLDGQVVMYVQTYLLLELAAGVLETDLATEGLYRTLRERHGVRVADGRRVIEAVLAEQPVAGYLEVEPGAPLLRVEAATLDTDDRPFETYRAWHRSDRSRIEVRVVPPEER